MKITDLELEQYGIYQNDSWKLAAGCLNVIMGENESGKTTLLRFIRDMMFGYERGKWQGKKGNMGFLRADGSAYRIYRDGKNKLAGIRRKALDITSLPFGIKRVESQ